MNRLRQIGALLCMGGMVIGAVLGYSFGHRKGVQEGLAADANAREIFISELNTLTTQNQQQVVSLKTANASIAELSKDIDDQQRAHELEVRELELYRRIELGTDDRGLHVEEVQLIDLGEGPVLRVTLLQIGARNEVQGKIGLALVGANLPGAVDSRLIIADPQGETGLEFDFRFMTRISAPLPVNLLPSEPSEEGYQWLEGLDLLEIDLIPRDTRGTQKRVTLPADRMIVGPEQ